MRKGLLLAVLILFTAPASADAPKDEPQLGVTLDVKYLSKWISKGARAYGSQGAVFETLNLDFYQTGFGVKITHRSATSDGYGKKQRFDYRPYYKGRLFEDETYATNFNLSVGYEHYYRDSRTEANTTYEWIYQFAWPNLLGEGFLPRYIAHYEYPASGADAFNHITGWVHRFQLNYAADTESLPQPLNFSSEVAYTDGLGGAGHDWSYTTFGLATTFNIADNLTFTPGVYYQISMEDTVNTNDELYAVVGLKHKF